MTDGDGGVGRDARTIIVANAAPSACLARGQRLHGADIDPSRRQVAELPEVRPDVTEYWLRRLACPRCGAVTRS